MVNLPNLKHKLLVAGSVSPHSVCHFARNLNYFQCKYTLDKYRGQTYYKVCFIVHRNYFESSKTVRGESVNEV